MVQQFKSAAFGKASFIRRGDGNQGYQAGIQNHGHITLRLLPWEDHAKRGIFFFHGKMDRVLEKTQLHPKVG